MTPPPTPPLPLPLLWVTCWCRHGRAAKRLQAALVNTTVPLLFIESPFPQWFGTSNVNNLFLEIQTSAVRKSRSTNRHTYSALITGTPFPNWEVVALIFRGADGGAVFNFFNLKKNGGPSGCTCQSVHCGPSAFVTSQTKHFSMYLIPPLQSPPLGGNGHLAQKA